MNKLRAQLAAALRALREKLPQRPLSYWLLALAILIASIWISPYLDDSLNLVKVRYWLFQNLNQSATNPARPRTVKLVIIGDDEYWAWGGQLAHRTPTNRRYLARIVDALDRADASVIALDFDVRLPDQNTAGTRGAYYEIEPAYLGETEELVATIGRVARKRPIVLSRTILEKPDDSYYMVADIYQPFGICQDLIGNGQWSNPGTRHFPLNEAAQENISCGYIGLPRDMRQIPPPLDVGRKGKLDSFSFAVVRAKDGPNAPGLSDRAEYGTYIPAQVLRDSHIIVSAHDLLSRDPRVFRRATAILRGSPVIVGAGWHTRGIGLGEQIDMHPTPIEKTNGAIIHENFAEAVLSDRHYPAVSETTLHLLEIAIGVLAIFGFALSQNLWVRVSALVGAALFLFALQWLTLQILGTFFEAFIPVFGVGLHSIIERIVSKE